MLNEQIYPKTVRVVQLSSKRDATCPHRKLLEVLFSIKYPGPKYDNLLRLCIAVFYRTSSLVDFGNVHTLT